MADRARELVALHHRSIDPHVDALLMLAHQLGLLGLIPFYLELKPYVAHPVCRPGGPPRSSRSHAPHDPPEPTPHWPFSFPLCLPIATPTSSATYGTTAPHSRRSILCRSIGPRCFAPGSMHEKVGTELFVPVGSVGGTAYDAAGQCCTFDLCWSSLKVPPTLGLVFCPCILLVKK